MTTRGSHTVYDAVCSAIRSLGELDPGQELQASILRSLARKLDQNATSVSGSAVLAHARASKDLAALWAALTSGGGMHAAEDIFRSILMDQGVN